MKKNKFTITSDDYKLLVNLWRWKFLTTTLIHLAIFKPRTITACYLKLLVLEKNKYIESFCSKDSKNWFWQLTEKGYQELNFDGLTLDQGGFKSEHKEHDFTATLFHLGALLKYKNTGLAVFTEQELRRLDVESYPKWVPHTRQHRPDGWWTKDINSNHEGSLISIEVELNLKPYQTYIDLGIFYSEVVSVDTVLWIVKTETDAKFIYKNLKIGSNTLTKEHSFIILNHWKHHLWQTPIFLGKNKGLNIENIFNTSAIPSQDSSLDHVLFNFQKKPIKSSSQSKICESVYLHSKIIGI